MGLTAAGAAIATSFGLATRAFIDFESSFAGVRKTVVATEPQFAELASDLRELATLIPVNVNELNRIAEAAGQLGIERTAILGFTETVAKLGVTTNLAADEAASALARIANIMQTPTDSFDRLGATIVALGNQLATTEAELVEFGLRMAGAGQIAGLTEADILAIGGALSSVGVQAEAGGTAVQKVLLTMTDAANEGGEKLQQFAQVAGLSAEQFAAAWRADPAQAFIAFVEGLGGSGQEAIGVLRELGLTDQRLIRSFLSLAGAGNLLRESIELGNEAWTENTALNIEAGRRFETTASQIQLAKNEINDLAVSVGETLAGGFEVVIRQVGLFASFINDLPSPLRAVAVALTGVVGGVSLIGGALLLALPRIARTREAMQDLGLSFASFRRHSSEVASGMGQVQTGTAGAATGFRRLALAAGRLGVAFAGLALVNEFLRELTTIDEEVQAAVGNISDSFETLDDVSTAQLGQLVRTIEIASEEAGSQFKTLSERAVDVGRQLLPFVDSATDKFGDFTKSAEELRVAAQALEGLERAQTLRLAEFIELQAQVNQARQDGVNIEKEFATELERIAELRDLLLEPMPTSEPLLPAHAINQNMLEVSRSLGTPQEALQDLIGQFEDTQRAMRRFAGMGPKEFRQWATETGAALGDVGGVLDGLADKSNLTAEQVIRAFERQLEAVRDYAENFRALERRRIPDAFLQQLAEMGLEGAGIVAALRGASKEELGGIVQDFRALSRAGVNIFGGLNTRTAETRQFFIDLRTEARLLVEQIGGLGGSQQDARRALRDLASSLGLTKQETRELIDELDIYINTLPRIPSAKSTNVTAPGLTPSIAGVINYVKQLGGVPRSKTTIFTTPGLFESNELAKEFLGTLRSVGAFNPMTITTHFRENAPTGSEDFLTRMERIEGFDGKTITMHFEENRKTASEEFLDRLREIAEFSGKTFSAQFQMSGAELIDGALSGFSGGSTKIQKTPQQRSLTIQQTIIAESGADPNATAAAVEVGTRRAFDEDAQRQELLLQAFEEE